MSEISYRIGLAIPVKAFGQAKSRLSPVMSAPDRERLARAVFSDVLAAAAAARSVAQAAVITADPEVTSLAQSAGMLVITDLRCAGQTAAVEQAAQVLEAQGCNAMLTLPGDLPLLTAHDIDAMCGLLSPQHRLVLARAVNDGGTNALLCTPPSGMRFHFGDNSFARHLQSARELGLEPMLCDLPGFRLDLDRPDDLEHFMAQPSNTHAYSFLQTIRLQLACGGCLG